MITWLLSDGAGTVGSAAELNKGRRVNADRLPAGAAELLRRYKSGEALGALAKATGVSRAELAEFLRARGVGVRGRDEAWRMAGRRRRKVDPEDAIRRRLAGESYKAIAEAQHVEAAGIQRLLWSWEEGESGSPRNALRVRNQLISDLRGQYPKWSVSGLAATVGCSAFVVRDVLSGGQTNTNRRPFDVADVQRRRTAGEGYAAIASGLGMGMTTLRRAMREWERERGPSGLNRSWRARQDAAIRDMKARHAEMSGAAIARALPELRISRGDVSRALGWQRRTGVATLPTGGLP